MAAGSAARLRPWSTRLRLAQQGADILDIGGESTRPYSTPVSAEEELERVMPVVEQVCRTTDLPVSIDTSKADVAEAALAAGHRSSTTSRGSRVILGCWTSP